jgi:glucokinase
MKYYLIIDIGGTKTSTSLFSQDGVLVDDYVYTRASKTFSGEDAVYYNSKGAIDHIIEKYSVNMDDVLGIGVGCPGPLDSKKGIIINAPMMRWKNFPLKDRLFSDYHKTVAIDNDCALGALAEQRRGLAKGLENVIYITVSTGVGSGIVLNGEIYHGKTDSAGELGHMSIEEDGKLCPCGNKGCLELYCSGTAIKQILADDARKGVKALVFEMAQGDESKLDGQLLAMAADQGDRYSIDLYNKIGKTLGFAITNVFNLFDPDMVVIGGGVSKSHAHFHDALLSTVKCRSIIHVEDNQIAYSEMCDRVVLYGAFHLIKELVEKGEQ